MQGKIGIGNGAIIPSPPPPPNPSSSTKEFIYSTYNPKIAVFSTPGANAISSKNNLSVTQLLAPFTDKIKVDVSWHEPLNGQLIQPRGLRITLVDVLNTKRKENKVDPDSVTNRKLLQNVVAQNPPSLDLEDENNKDGRVWFSAWRDQFLKVQVESSSSAGSQQYDYLNHFMACVFAMSSEDGKSVEDTVSKLSKAQQHHQNTWANCWAFPNVLKFYLVLHEKGVVEQEKADLMIQSLRTTYGGNYCFMVQLVGSVGVGVGADDNSNDNTDNSHIWSGYVDGLPEPSTGIDLEPIINDEEIVIKSDVIHPLSPDSDKVISDSLPQNGKVLPLSPSMSSLRGQNLSTGDIASLRLSIIDLVNKALVPYIDRQSKLLHESIVNRRGMSKSFFSATKRLFGGSAKTQMAIVYTNESLEMMSRKLADVYFLFGHYAGAYQLYHQLKKDFLGDAAWVYYASALEMAAVSHFMMTQMEPPLAIVRAFPVHYIGEAITHYVDNCRMPDAAIRCALVCCECLKKMENYSEAASIYIRMTSEDCDLRSALMLEQAAAAFGRVKYMRKYALHSVLAGNRYSKAGLKMHSLKCYLQADQIYAGRGWRFAEDHIHFTIARLQHSLQRTSDLSKYLQLLLITPTPQPVNQVSLFYKEYLTMMATTGCKEPLEFSIPKIICSYICVRIGVSELPLGEIGHQIVEEETGVRWGSLEEEVTKDSDPTLMSFRPSRTLFRHGTDNTVHPIAPTQEYFFVDIPLRNSLSIPITVKNIRLVCNGIGAAESTIVPLLELSPLQAKLVRFGLKGTHVGSVSFDWMHYELESPPVIVHFKQKITLQGPRLNSTKKERCGRIHAKDLRNRINIVEKMPLLQASVDFLPASLYHCQTTNFCISLRDVSSDMDQKQRIQDFVLAMDNMSEMLQIKEDSNTKLSLTKKNYVRFSTQFSTDTTNQNPSSFCSIPCTVRAPSSGESMNLQLMILYYFRSLDESKIHHRVLKITVKVPLINCLRMEYSMLKLLDSVTYLGLLRAHNVTQDGHISFTRIHHQDTEYKIMELRTNRNDEGDAVTLGPMESRNIIIKTTNSQLGLNPRDIYLLLDWELHKTESAVSGCSKLLIQDLVPILSQDENHFIFELSHRSLCQNDFNQSPCLFHGVELIVHSRVSGNFTLKIDKNSSQSTLVGPGANPSGDEVTFIGQTSWNLDILPFQTYILRYTVSLTHPGVFNVAPILTISGKGDADPLHPKKYVLHSPLIVTHANATDHDD